MVSTAIHSIVKRVSCCSVQLQLNVQLFLYELTNYYFVILYFFLIEYKTHECVKQSALQLTTTCSTFLILSSSYIMNCTCEFHEYYFNCIESWLLCSKMFFYTFPQFYSSLSRFRRKLKTSLENSSQKSINQKLYSSFQFPKKIGMETSFRHAKFISLHSI